MSRKRSQKRHQSSYQYENHSHSHYYEQGQTVESPCFSTTGVIGTDKFLKPANYNQRKYVESIKKNTLTLVHGCAGTGKSIMALHTAVYLMNSDQSPIDKIYYIRANVGMVGEEGLGFIPGDLKQKVLQLAYPVIDNLSEFMSAQKAQFLVESGRIEVLPVAMIRGRSFNRSIIIADEQQNSSPHMVKTLLTRIGQDSKMVLMGDTSQKDTRAAQADGLKDAIWRLRDLEGVGVIEFEREDILRNEIISHILERYDTD